MIDDSRREDGVHPSYWEEKFQIERDRRLSEISIEKEKALKIKETADAVALSLARDIQVYKDEKANELREQINRERAEYATRIEMAALDRELRGLVRPLVEYVSSQRGRAEGTRAIPALVLAVASIIAVVSTVVAMVTIFTH